MREDITEEQLEFMGDDELALLANRFSRFHNNRMNRRRGGGRSGCFECGDPNHFIANCPKKNKQVFGKADHGHKYDSGKRKEKYVPAKHKRKGGFDKEYIKKKYLEKAQAEQRAFFATLSDVDGSDDDSACSSDDESEKKKRIEDKLNGLCFFADDEGFCTMALGDEVDGKLEDTPRNDDGEKTGVGS